LRTKKQAPGALHGLPVGFTLTGAKTDERQVFLNILVDGTETMNQLQQDEGRQLMIGDKNYYGAGFEDTVDAAGIEMLRPARKGEKPSARGQVLQARAAGHRISQRHPHGAA
jgi:hypothetical protein